MPLFVPNEANSISLSEQLQGIILALNFINTWYCWHKGLGDLPPRNDKVNDDSAFPCVAMHAVKQLLIDNLKAIYKLKVNPSHPQTLKHLCVVTDVPKGKWKIYLFILAN